MGAWHIQALKTAALCAIFILSGMGSLAQARQAPKPPATVKAPEPSSSVKPKPRAEELERWRQTIVHTPLPEKACFVVEYPETIWTKVPCAKPPKVAHRPSRRPGSIKLGGANSDDAAQVLGHISSAEGSFDAVIGVHSACSAKCPNHVCPTNYKCSSGNLKNNYSLQLNTNTFQSTKACKGCVVWEQFVFSNRHCTPPSLSALLAEGMSLEEAKLYRRAIGWAPACAFIQYWLLFEADGITPYTQCPSGWGSTHPRCFINSAFAVPFKPFLADDLGFMKLRGVIGDVHGKEQDAVIFTYADKIYGAPGDGHFPELATDWNEAEFNVFGIDNGSEVILNPGSTLVVRIAVDNGTKNAPMCARTGFTGESNNLEPIALPAFFPNPPPSTYPALVFAETNDPNATYVYLCQGVALIP